jgi:hypothetical protein
LLIFCVQLRPVRNFRSKLYVACSSCLYCSSHKLLQSMLCMWWKHSALLLQSCMKILLMICCMMLHTHANMFDSIQNSWTLTASIPFQIWKQRKTMMSPPKRLTLTVSMYVNDKQTTMTCWRTTNRLRFENGEKRYNSKHVCLCETIRIHHHRYRKMEIIYSALHKHTNQETCRKEHQPETKRNPHKKNL